MRMRELIDMIREGREEDDAPDTAHRSRMLTKRISALQSRLKSRKRDDVARRDTVRKEIEQVKAERDALPE